MSIPIYKHQSRSIKIEKAIFLSKRKSVFSRKSKKRNIECSKRFYILNSNDLCYPNWILKFLNFAKKKNYSGLAVTVPKAINSIY